MAQHLFTDCAFFIDGWSKSMYVMNRAAVSPAAACVGLHHFSLTNALKFQVIDAMSPTARLSIEELSVTDIPEGRLSSVMGLNFLEQDDPLGLMGQSCLRFDLLKTGYSEDASVRLVLDGIGTTYLEATDPITFKMFQFNPLDTVYLCLAPQVSIPSYPNFEGQMMQNLLIQWGRE